MNIFEKAIQKLEGLFKSGKVTAALESVAQLAVEAAPIVQEIEVLVPTTNRTVTAIEAAYTKYAVPVATQITSDPASMQAALQTLAATVLAKNLPPAQAGAATSVLNAAVTMAVAAAHA